MPVNLALEKMKWEDCQVSRPAKATQWELVSKNQRPTREYRLLALLSVVYQNWMARPYGWRHGTPWKQKIEISHWKWPRTFSLLDRFSFIKLCNADCFKEKSSAVSHCINLPSRKCPPVQEWHDYYGHGVTDLFLIGFESCCKSGYKSWLVIY